MMITNGQALEMILGYSLIVGGLGAGIAYFLTKRATEKKVVRHLKRRIGEVKEIHQML